MYNVPKSANSKGSWYSDISCLNVSSLVQGSQKFIIHRGTDILHQQSWKWSGFISSGKWKIMLFTALKTPKSSFAPSLGWASDRVKATLNKVMSYVYTSRGARLHTGKSPVYQQDDQYTKKNQTEKFHPLAWSGIKPASFVYQHDNLKVILKLPYFLSLGTQNGRICNAQSLVNWNCRFADYLKLQIHSNVWMWKRLFTFFLVANAMFFFALRFVSKTKNVVIGIGTKQYLIPVNSWELSRSIKL